MPWSILPRPEDEDYAIVWTDKSGVSKVRYTAAKATDAYAFLEMIEVWELVRGGQFVGGPPATKAPKRAPARKVQPKR